MATVWDGVFLEGFQIAPGERFWRIENHGRKKLLSLYVLLFCFGFFFPQVCELVLFCNSQF